MVDSNGSKNKLSSGILSITIKDKAVLYAAYMHFLLEGGLFIPTKKNFYMGQELSLAITLLDEPEKYKVSGTVVWKTPIGVHGNRAPGIGIKFQGEKGKILRKKIEGLLATLLKSENNTHTM